MQGEKYKYEFREADSNNTIELKACIKQHSYASTIFQKQLNKINYPRKLSKTNIFLLNIYAGENGYIIWVFLCVGTLFLFLNTFIDESILLVLGLLICLLSITLLLLKIVSKNLMKKISNTTKQVLTLNYDGKSIVYTNQEEIHSWLVKNIFCVCVFEDGIIVIFNKSNVYFNLIESQFVEKTKYRDFVERLIKDVNEKRVIYY